MDKITKIYAREIIDSRATPTIEVEVYAGDLMAKSIVPSGKSTGIYEAVELRDGDKNRFFGKGVLRAIKNINEVIAPKLLGKDPRNQEEIDKIMIELDGTENKSNLGGNAMVGVSMACLRLAAKIENLPLYLYISEISKTDLKMRDPLYLFFNVINGGLHAGNNLDIQEHIIVPQVNSLKESVRMASEVYHNLKNILKERLGNQAINVGDEGGFAPNFENYYKPFDFIQESIEKSGYKNKIKIAIDAAASSFYKDKEYQFGKEKLNSDELLKVYDNLISNYPFISIEDPFDEDDFKGFFKINEKHGEKILIVGDDLTVSNPKRIELAEKKKSCNTLLLKVNQVGTITEALESVNLAKKYRWKIIVSHRSGDSEDSFIADLAFGIGAYGIKSGAPARSERTAKYNQLIRIEEDWKSR